MVTRTEDCSDDDGLGLITEDDLTTCDETSTGNAKRANPSTKPNMFPICIQLI